MSFGTSRKFIVGVLDSVTTIQLISVIFILPHIQGERLELPTNIILAPTPGDSLRHYSPLGATMTVCVYSYLPKFFRPVVTQVFRIRIVGSADRKDVFSKA